MLFRSNNSNLPTPNGPNIEHNFPPVNAFQSYEIVHRVKENLLEYEEKNLTQAEVIMIQNYYRFVIEILGLYWDINNPIDPDFPDLPRREMGEQMWQHNGQVVQ